MSRPSTRHRYILVLYLALLCVLASNNACLPSSSSSPGTVNITVYGFSIMKEVLEKAIYPGFSAQWRLEHGQDIHFSSSFAGSETITNQILQGAQADVTILASGRDAERLRNGKSATSDWHQLPHGGLINKTPFIILVRQGNPKNIRDFADLARPGVKLIHPDPTSSGGAQWSILSIYGSELKKSEQATGVRNESQAEAQLRAIWRNVISTPGSAREARTQFETGFGDALITYEQEGLLMKDANSPVEMVIPESTVFSEHPVVVVDRNVSSTERQAVDAFIKYLWSDEAQNSFVRFHLRAITDEQLNQKESRFAQIKLPFTIEYFGGWDSAYKNVIDGVWRDRVQKAK